MENFNFRLLGCYKVWHTFSIVFIAVILTLSFQSCEQQIDEIAQNTDVLKTGANTSSESIVYWGPEKYVRTTGEVNVFKVKIGSEDLAHFESEFTLQLKNGDGKKNLVSSAIVKVDGKEVFGVSDFSQKVKILSESISGIAEHSVLEVEVRGIPGSFVEVWIEGKLIPGYAQIGKSGGEVISENGLVKINVPIGSLENNQIIGITEIDVEMPEYIVGQPMGKHYNLEPNGLHFLKPVKITLNYAAEISNIPSLAQIGILHLSNGFADIIPVINNKDNHEITFNLNDFSSFIPIWTNTIWTVYNMYWIIPKIKWYLVTPGGSSFLTESNIMKALNMWQDKTSSFIFERTYKQEEANITFVEFNTIDFDAISCGFGMRAGIYGQACFRTFKTKLGENDNVEIRLASNVIQSNGLAINAIAHEVGHALGIGHLKEDNPNSIMNEVIKQVNQELHPWDMEALYYHYEPNTILTGSFTDSRDGKTYKTVKIGNQWWMAENLAYLPSVSPPTMESTTNPYYYVYGYYGTNVEEAKATSNYSTYGVLYNWPAAINSCPSGWHLPSESEWQELFSYLVNNGYGYEGSGDDINKSLAAQTNWNTSSIPGSIGNEPYSNNSSGFSALPAGDRSTVYPYFFYIGVQTSWWSSTLHPLFDNAVWVHGLWYASGVYATGSSGYNMGKSVRCVKD